MTRYVCFFGGNSQSNNVTVNDFNLFFTITRDVAAVLPGYDWDLITDRLYRRYLKQDQLDEATKLMGILRTEFARYPRSQVNWIEHPVEPDYTALNNKLPTLADIFDPFFPAFDRAVGCARAHFKIFNQYLAVRIIVAGVEGIIYDNSLKLDDYENNDGAPFWAR